MHPTPASRAKELPDEFIVKDKNLFCKWCNKVIVSLRKDNIVQHLHSNIHQENRMEQGAPMSFNPNSRRMKKIKDKRKQARQNRNPPSGHNVTPQSLSDNDDSDIEDESEEDLKNIFNESDSGETDSFEGFDESAVFEVSKKVKKSKHGSTLISPRNLASPPNKKRKGNYSSEEGTSPIAIKSLPLKKQLSYSARVTDVPTPTPKGTKKGALKIKISRKPKEKSKSFKVESSGTESSEIPPPEDAVEHKGIKMKFFIKKLDNKAPKQRKKPGRKRKSTEAKEQQHEDFKPSMDHVSLESPHKTDKMEVFAPSSGEVIEEEIVGVDEGVVVSWEDIAPEGITEAENLARKANHARKMAKSVNSAQFKKKRLATPKKKRLTKQEEKKQRQSSGYNLWSSRMRKQVALQFPGLQFGEVSKKLGDLWKRIPEKEKQMWKYRSVKMVEKMREKQPNKRKQGSKMIETGPRKRLTSPLTPNMRNTTLAPYPPHRNPEQTMKRELGKLTPPSLDPIDVAAHLHLIGESLLNIGKKVRISTSPTPLSGSLPTLLDAFMCSMAPLVALTNQVPELEDSIPEQTLCETLTNIAYILPGV